jgi:hypothetical protein
MDTRRRMLLRSLSVHSREQVVGVWIRNGSDRDVLHLVLEYILSSYKRVELSKGQLVLFRLKTGAKPESFLVEPQPSRWVYHCCEVDTAH